ncbi:Fungalysin metallopeptidase-domain-containing protein [Flammula alnicola]|nr:Fungalysin metallopeptidase-domain-containing protein [Flammula alnicola]
MASLPVDLLRPLCIMQRMLMDREPQVNGALQRATRRLIKIGSGVHVEAYHPQSTFETFAEGIDHPLSKRDTFSFIVFKSGFAGDVAQHAFLTQTHVTLRVSHLQTPWQTWPSTTIKRSYHLAPSFITKLDGQYNNHPTTIEFFAKPDNTAVLTHVVQIQNETAGTWYEAFVDAHSGELVSVTDFVAQASYTVLPIQEETLIDGFQTLTDPRDLATTVGNNVFSFKGTAASPSIESAAGLVFNYPQDPTLDPTVQGNVDAARVNAFYIVNTMHDLTYRYGFTESSFNFQSNNFGKGGAQNDSVSISVQDSSSINNADFTTPPDGQSGRMRMYIWNFTTPNRDGALENDIVTHEMMHGVTNRMTGGGTGRCLQTLESFGMGEGWSDAMANWNEKTSNATPDYVVGQYVSNDPAGTTGPTTLPTHSNILICKLVSNLIVSISYEIKSWERFKISAPASGEIWANMLYNVYAAFVGVYGWSATARTNPTGTEGNIVFLHLFLDALALQPCNPTYIAMPSLLSALRRSPPSYLSNAASQPARVEGFRTVGAPSESTPIDGPQYSHPASISVPPPSAVLE